MIREDRDSSLQTDQWVGKADRSGLSASSPKKNRLKSFVVEAAISSSWCWDKIMSSCPPLLRRTTCLLRGKEMTPFRESELCNGCLRPQPFWMWRGICIESGRFERLHRCPTRWRGRIAPSLSTSSVTGRYAFLYCVAISVFLTPVPSYRCMPVRMIFGSINACPFELLKRCNFFVYNYSCPLTG